MAYCSSNMVYRSFLITTRRLATTRRRNIRPTVFNKKKQWEECVTFRHFSSSITTRSSASSSSKRRISRPPPKKKNSPRQRRTNKPSPATILLDQWDMTPGSSTNNNNNATTKNTTTNQEVQRKRFQERQKVFCNAIVEYRNIWFNKKKKSDDDNNNVATHWKHAMQFQHPITTTSTITTIQQRLMESEPIFVRICSLCHELFVTTALLAESELPSGHQKQKQQQESMDFLTSVLPFWETMRKERTLLVERYYNHSSSLSTNDDDEDTTVGVAPLVEPAVQSSNNTNGSNWVKWIKSMVLRGATNAPPTTIHSIPQKQQQQQSPLTAHQDLQYAPNHYHYNKLIGRLYFSYPPLLALLLQQEEQQQQQHDSKQLLEILEQRALCIQRIFDQIPQNGNTAPTAVLTDKTVRLLIRSYQDIGTLEAAYQTEQVYHQYPTHRKGLLWYVLMSYLQVTQRYSTTTTTTTSSSSGGGAGGSTSSSSSSQAGLPPAPIHRTKFSPKSASLATKRICELLSKQQQQQQQVIVAGQQQQQQRNGTSTTTTMKMMMNPNEFQSCSTIGFQSLANITVDSLDHYYERVHALAVLKFGSHTWETLVSNSNNNQNNKHNLQLRSKDVASLHLLVQIYAKMKDNNNENNDNDDDEYLKKAKTLFQNMWTIFSINELKESMPRTTFHSILEAMDKKKQQQRSKARGRRRQEESENINTRPDQEDDDDYEFDYALGLFDKMMTNKVWYPNAETFNVLFRLAEWGHQADQVLTRLELCRWIQQQQQEGEYPISLLTASKHALRAWVHTAKHTNQQQQQENDNTAMERAYSIFQNLQVSSRPLLYQTNPEKVSHIYDVNNAPTLICYSLVWETCWHIGKNSSDKKTRQRAVEIATNLYQHATKEQQQQDNVLGSFGANSYRLFLQCLSLSDDEQQRLALVRDVFETAASHDSNNKTSIMNSTEFLEALLDCLCNDVSSSFSSTSSSSSSQLEQQRRLELIQDIYNVVVSTHEMPIMSDRFLTLLGRLHPQLHDRYLAEHKQGKNELVKEGK
eukprot:scaffold3437_cov113-Cylindrotheca_fusiformis.AAC.23